MTSLAEKINLILFSIAILYSTQSYATLLGTPLQLLVTCITQQQLNAFRYTWSKGPCEVQTVYTMVKKCDSNDVLFTPSQVFIENSLREEINNKQEITG